MQNYPITNIFIEDKYEFSLPFLYSELDLLGSNYHQNTDNNKRKEFHYFLGTSSVIISEYEKKANIKIISRDDLYLNDTKSKIEKILEKARPLEIK